MFSIKGSKYSRQKQYKSKRAVIADAMNENRSFEIRSKLKFVVEAITEAE